MRRFKAKRPSSDPTEPFVDIGMRLAVWELDLGEIEEAIELPLRELDVDLHGRLSARGGCPRVADMRDRARVFLPLRFVDGPGERGADRRVDRVVVLHRLVSDETGGGGCVALRSRKGDAPNFGELLARLAANEPQRAH